VEINMKKYNMVYREYAVRENTFEVTAENEEDARRQARDHWGRHGYGDYEPAPWVETGKHNTFIVEVVKDGE
jgi:hypothetical protein